MKHLVTMILAILTSVNLAFGYDFSYNSLQYTIVSATDKTVSVTGSNSSNLGNLVIPQRVSNGGTIYTVVEIGENALKSTNLTSVTIPPTVNYIMNYAFYDNNIRKVYISDLMAWLNISFGFRAGPLYEENLYRANCHLYLNGEEIIDLVIPNECTEIKEYAFSGGVFKTVTIPPTVTTIGSDAFWNCSSLEKVNISDLIAWCNIDFEDAWANPLYYANHLYLNGAEITQLTIPDQITKIKPCTFSGGSYITSLTLPSSVTEIGESAFRSCSGITSLTMPSSVTEIGISAFRGCSGITSLTLPSSVTEIGNCAFYECTGLQSVTCCWENQPITCSENIFSDEVYNRTLYVPTGTTDKYYNTVPWYRFAKIVETSTTDIKGIDAATDSAVRVVGNTIQVSGESLVQIVDLNGKAIYTGQGNCSVDVPKGVYIVIVGEKQTKVVI